MGRKNTKNPGEKPRFRIVYAVIALIFLYVIVQSFFLAQNGRAGYVVAQIGDLQEVKEFTGVITRQEQLIRAPQGGVVEYYYPGNRHLSKGAQICSLRDNYYGDFLKQKLEDVYQQLLNEASASDYAEDFKKLDEQLGEQIAGYIRRKTPNNYASLYAMKTAAQTTIGQRDNLLAILQNSTINALLQEQGIYTEQMDEKSVSVSLPAAGMISYTYDDYEGWTWEQVGPEFAKQYQKNYQTITLNLQEIQQGDPLYRLITSQNWYITLFVDEQQSEMFEKGEKVSFFIETDELSAVVIEREQQAEQYKIVLEVSDYLADYANMRIAQLKFKTSGEEGIKIPKECILEKSFYKAQKKYLYNSSGKQGLMIKGNSSDDFYPVGVVYTEELPEGAAEGEQYVYFELPANLKEGSLMIENGTASVAPIGEKETLPYVYTINGGYQVQKVVTIQYESDRYAIVKGISLYDRVMIP